VALDGAIISKNLNHLTASEKQGDNTALCPRKKQLIYGNVDRTNPIMRLLLPIYICQCAMKQRSQENGCNHDLTNLKQLEKKVQGGGLIISPSKLCIIWTYLSCGTTGNEVVQQR